MKGGSCAVVTEPGGDVAYGGAVGVVEVVASREDLDAYGGTSLRAPFAKGVEQARVQPLLEEEVGGKARLHYFLRYRSAELGGLGVTAFAGSRGEENGFSASAIRG